MRGDVTFDRLNVRVKSLRLNGSHLQKCTRTCHHNYQMSMAKIDLVGNFLLKPIFARGHHQEITKMLTHLQGFYNKKLRFKDFQTVFKP